MASPVHLFISAFLLASSSIQSSSAIVAGLKLKDDESSICWDSLIQLQSCTGELIMFFPECRRNLLRPRLLPYCITVRAIAQQCWPTIIDALGFTPEET
ncbi:hypothetical protein REPUB_Repub19eG0126300 [Reevesia pubescens]